MYRKFIVALLTCLLFTLSCKEDVLSDLTVERMDENLFPLQAYGLTREKGVVTVLYQFLSEDCLCTAGPVLKGPGLQHWTVTVNGTPFAQKGGPFAVSGFVQEGENVIELQGDLETPSLTLAGDFDVLPAPVSSGWYLRSAKTLGLGSLASQGLPFYRGVVSYHRQFEFPEKVGRRVLRLSGWAGSACSLWVNYSKVADITTQDFKMDIGPYLLAGPNDVEVRICAWPADGDAALRDFGLSKAFTLK